MSRTIIYVHVYIFLDFPNPITNKNASKLYQTECACLHQTVNTIVFFSKTMKIPPQMGHSIYNAYVIRIIFQKND